jgi:hypothetical protein
MPQPVEDNTMPNLESLYIFDDIVDTVATKDDSRSSETQGVGFELATKDYLPGVNELIARMIEEPSLDDSTIIKQWWNT